VEAGVPSEPAFGLLGWKPVVRGLVACPEDWRWSSYRSYAYREAGLVRINDWAWWEEKIRHSAG
jgi:hypothetical protein